VAESGPAGGVVGNENGVAGVGHPGRRHGTDLVGHPRWSFRSTTSLARGGVLATPDHGHDTASIALSMVWLCTLGWPISTIAADCEVQTDLPSPPAWQGGVRRAELPPRHRSARAVTSWPPGQP